jgi:hypothetical protein
MAKDNSTPAYHAYVVTKREGKDDWWTQIGSAWEHADQLGLNIVLQALPIPGPDGECKIVLRPPKTDTNERSDQRQDQRDEPRATRSQPNNRGRRS